MKIIDFGKVLKKIREVENLTQGDLVDLIDYASGGVSGVDSVTVSRWENNVVVPCHRRQIDIVKGIGFELNKVIEPDVLLVDDVLLKEHLIKKMVGDKYWDFSETGLEAKRIVKKRISTTDNRNESDLYLDSVSSIPIAQLLYRIQDDVVSEGEKSLVIHSIYCISPYLLLDIIHTFTTALISNDVEIVLYKSKNRNLPINKYLKTLGFKCLGKIDGEYISALTVHDVIYNQYLFYISCCYTPLRVNAPTEQSDSNSGYEESLCI